MAFEDEVRGTTGTSRARSSGTKELHMNSSHGMDRRGFIRTTGGAVAGTGLLWMVGVPDVLAARPAPVATRYPLHIPPAVSPNGLTLTAAPSIEDLGGGSMAKAWTYNSELPGPTIVASRGDIASISLVNGLPEETITHWHGMLVDDVNDGH